MKVMIIDDEKAMHLIMRKMLAKLQDIEIVGCYFDTDSAASYLEEHEVHMAFVDIGMPGESGLHFAARMAERHPNLNIVFVTSHKDYALEAFDLFALDYVVKPVSLERIEKSIKRAMTLHRFVVTANGGRETGRIRIYALGGLELQSANGRVKWRSAKSKELFGYLLIQRGRMVSRAKIVSDVFGEMPHKNAETYLYTAIYQIRKSLEPHGLKSMIKSDNDGYGLDIAEASVDFIAFEGEVKLFAAGDDTLLDSWVETEERFVGDLFGEKAYGWALADIERLSTMHAGFVKKLAGVLQVRQEYGTAVRLLNKLLGRNEFDEETVQLLLGVYAAQKDNGSFTKLFKRYEKTVRQELGIAPSKELGELYARFQAEMKRV